MRTSTKEERTKAINMVKNGMTYSGAAREIGVSFETMRRWCANVGVYTSFTHTKKTDDKIISVIKESKAVTQTELSQLLDYQNMTSRLRGMVMHDKVNSIIIPGSSSSSKIRGPLYGYQNTRLYYIEKEDLTDWLIEKLPKHMPLGMRRAVTQKLNSAGINIADLNHRSKYSSVALSKNVYKKLKAISKKRGISMRILVETLIKEGLDKTDDKDESLL